MAKPCSAMRGKARLPDMSQKYEGLLEIFDARDRLLMYAPFQTAQRQQLRRHAVLVALMDHQGKLFVTRIARSRMYYPGCWNISAMGYTQRGETVEETALRELEAGLNYRASDRQAGRPAHGGNLRLLTILPAAAETGNTDMYIFKTRPCAVFPVINRDLLEDGMFLDKEEVAALTRVMPEAICPPLALSFRHIFEDTAPDDATA